MPKRGEELRGENTDLRVALRDSWLELNKTLATVSTWQQRAAEAERELSSREDSLAAQEEVVRQALAAVEKQRRELDEVVRRTQESAAELVKQAEHQYGQEAWTLQGKIAALQKTIKKLEDENLLRRRQVWALRDDVLASLKRRNPAASPATLLKLLEDILPAGVDVEMGADDIVDERNAQDTAEDEGTGPQS